MTSWLNLRAVALGVSVAAHSGIALLAYEHAPRSPVARAVESDPTVEVSLAQEVEPEPVAEPLSPNQAQAVPHAVAATHFAPAAPTPAVGLPAAPNAADSIAPSAPLESAESAEPAAPRFIMQAPVVSGGNTPLAPANPVAGPGRADADAAPFSEGQVDRPAKQQSGAPPSYTTAAEAAGVEVELPLELVIDRAGSVQSARTLQHVGYGLDEAAVAAVQRYRFSPAWRAGKPVAVRMRYVLRFQLR
jgi:periplasmic protein TonB